MIGIVRTAEAGRRRHKKRQHHFQPVHHVDERHRRQSGDHSLGAVQNGVGNHALIHDHYDTARDADNQRDAQQISRAVDKG